MKAQNNNYRESELKINGIAVTNDCLTGRAGLAFFVNYIRRITLFPLINQLFGNLRKSKKGATTVELFKQIFCFMLDGTSRHLVYFDNLKQDKGYAPLISHKTCSEEATTILTQGAVFTCNQAFL